MKTKLIYIAEDGTPFDDRDACVKHDCETGWQVLNGRVFLWDKHGERLPLCLDSYNRAIYLKIKTDEAAVSLNSLLIEAGYITPWEGAPGPRSGVWFSDEESSGWVDAERAFEKWRAIIKIMNSDE